MRTPIIELIPSCAANAANTSRLDVMVKIIPPSLAGQNQRPNLNLAIVIDRSSSMAYGNRMAYAKAAARHIVQELLPSDRVSIITFDYDVTVLVPNTFATDKESILQHIQRIETGKWTNLHAGWVAGVQQVSQQNGSNTLNRVIILSDGWASVGVTTPKQIVADIKDITSTGISTSTLGLGNQYNEDLLENMATAGDGNYFYIHQPQQLPQIFEQELQTLCATLGINTTLGIEPQNGVEVVDILNDLDSDSIGRFRLSNLIAGHPLLVIVQFQMPMAITSDLMCYFRIAWEDPQTSQLQVTRLPLRLPSQHASMASLTVHPEVQQHMIVLKIARCKRAAIALADREDYAGAQAQLDVAQVLLLDALDEALRRSEQQEIGQLKTDLQTKKIEQFRKRSKYQSYRATFSPYQTFHGQDFLTDD